MSYWSDRFIKMEASRYNKSGKTTKLLGKVFNRSTNAIESIITGWYGRLAANNELPTMADSRRFLTASELKEFKWSVDEYIAYGRANAITGQWMKELENASARVHISRAERLKIDVTQETVKLSREYEQILKEHLQDTYTDSYLHSAFTVQKGIGVGWTLDGVNDRAFQNALNNAWTTDGMTFSQRIWRNQVKLVGVAEQAVSKMLLLGETPEKAIKTVSKAMNSSYANAARLVMTESAFFSEKASEVAFKDMGLEKYQYVATLDEITCPNGCQDLDGQVFLMRDRVIGVNAPPMHPCCRCTTAPYFDDEFTEGEMRAARGEDKKTYLVPASMTYKEWKESYVNNRVAVR